MNTFRILLYVPLSVGFACALPAATLSSNLASPVDPNLTELVSGSNWIGSSFGTGNWSSALTSVTIPVKADTSGAIGMDLYSSIVPGGGPSWGQPSTLIGSLQTPSSISSGDLRLATFGGNGLLLAPATTYWLVLTASSGAYEWAYASSSNGTGVGFQNTWTVSPDSGTDWITFNGTPMIMGVDATAPEPASMSLIELGIIVLLFKPLLMEMAVPAATLYYYVIGISQTCCRDPQ